MSAQTGQRDVASTLRVSSDQRDKILQNLRKYQNLYFLKWVLDDTLGSSCDIPGKNFSQGMIVNSRNAKFYIKRFSISKHMLVPKSRTKSY